MGCPRIQVRTVDLLQPISEQEGLLQKLLRILPTSMEDHPQHTRPEALLGDENLAEFE
jgi:hypothetical protein